MRANPDNTDLEPFPRLDLLHERHRGLSQNIAGYYAEAASVCLGKHHSPPKPLMVSAENTEDSFYLVDWKPSTGELDDCWANRTDRIEAAAYGLALAAAEVHLGLVAISRAEEGSGADYYIGNVGHSYANEDDGLLDMENLVRLEVSGIELDANNVECRARLKLKVSQLRKGQSNLPGVAGVAVINPCQVAFRKAC